MQEGIVFVRWYLVFSKKNTDNRYKIKRQVTSCKLQVGIASPTFSRLARL